jgi:hypothetical protein
MGNLKEWNTPPSPPPDRAGHGNRVPVYHASDWGDGIEYYPAVWEDPKALIQHVADIAAGDKEFGIEVGPDEKAYYRVGQDKPGRDANTKEGRSALAEDLGLPNKKKKKRNKRKAKE